MDDMDLGGGSDDGQISFFDNESGGGDSGFKETESGQQSFLENPSDNEIADSNDAANDIVPEEPNNSDELPGQTSMFDDDTKVPDDDTNSNSSAENSGSSALETTEKTDEIPNEENEVEGNKVETTEPKNEIPDEDEGQLKEEPKEIEEKIPEEESEQKPDAESEPKPEETGEQPKEEQTPESQEPQSDLEKINHPNMTLEEVQELQGVRENEDGKLETTGEGTGNDAFKESLPEDYKPNEIELKEGTTMDDFNRDYHEANPTADNTDVFDHPEPEIELQDGKTMDDFNAEYEEVNGPLEDEIANENLDVSNPNTPSEEEHPETVSYVQSAEDNEKYKSDLEDGDDVPQPPDGRFVTDSKDMDNILDSAESGAGEHAKDVNEERASKLQEEMDEKPWEDIKGYDTLEEAGENVPEEEPEHNPVYEIDEVEARNQLVEEQLGKPEHSLGDEEIYRTDVDVTDETVLEKPTGNESTNNGMGVANDVDEYVLKSPEKHDSSKVSKL